MFKLGVFGLLLTATLSASPILEGTYTQPLDVNGSLWPTSNKDTPTGGYAAGAMDNFTLSAPTLLSSVTFFGGYFDSAGGRVGGFTIDLLNDRGGAPVFGFPENPGLGGAANFTETPDGFLQDGTQVYKYQLPLEDLPLDAGRYWLFILAVGRTLPGPYPDWGWASGTGGDGTFYTVHEFQFTPVFGDLAFSLTYGPEPGTYTLVAIALAGILLWRTFGSRRRSSSLRIQRSPQEI